MSITAKSFGRTPEGEEVTNFIMDNGLGLKAEILNYGGIVKNLFVNGVDVVLGRDTLEEYLKNDGYYGAAIGRHANRIAGGRFELGEDIFNVGVNEGENSLHGGNIGFDRRVWTAAAKDYSEPQLVLTLNSPDGEEGFPGNLRVMVTYTLTSDNSLKIHYYAESDKDTLVNLTNHSYFNLGGHNSGNIENHTMWINSDFYTPNGSDCMPTGEVLSVKGTPFDFTKPKAVGQDINSDFEQVHMFSGYDHNFALNGFGFRKAAEVSCDETGIVMTMFTDRPAVQLYTGNGIDTKRICKDGEVYGIHQGLCLETQCFPNAMSHSHYPGPILRAGERYDTVTEYKFTF